MNNNVFSAIPENFRDAATTAVSSAFRSSAPKSMQTVTGGVSGALTYRLEIDDRSYLLRIETRRNNPLRNPHQYTCMRIAADAGIAPPLQYVDDNAGIAIIEFVNRRPLEHYPGGPAALVSAIGKLLARLQQTPSFPVLGDYRMFVDRILGYVGKVFAPGLLDQHIEGFKRIRDAYPWDASAHVSSHNDPNPQNILFDGERLWLIDWETAYRNDPLMDISVITLNNAATPELEDVLLHAWLGRPPDRLLRARLILMRQMTRLYYAGLLLALSGAGSEPITDLSAPSPEEFRAAIASGQLKLDAPEPKLILGKMLLAGFHANLNTADFRDALATVQTG